MSKVFKKLTGLLLALLMVVTLIPVMGDRARAEEPAFSLLVNGKDTGVYVTREWMEENSIGPQIFPWAAKKGQQWGYIVAKGPSYETVLTQLEAVTALSDLENATLLWQDNPETAPSNPLNNLEVSDLQAAVSCFKLVDGDGNDITGGFKGPGDAEAVALEEANDVTPIIAVEESEVYPTYAEAVEAVENENWSTSTYIRPYLGGNLKKDAYLKKDGVVDDGSVNFTGRFSMSDMPYLNIELTPTLEISAMTFTSTAAKTAKLPFDLTDAEVKMLYGAATWTSSDEAVATVDQNGKITPAGKIGSCTVTATLDGVIGRCKVTVASAAFAPAKPVWSKAVNVKTRSAKLTWKKAANASGYIVYRSTKKTSGFKKIATIKKGTTVTYTNKKLTKGKTYYYKIKAYRNYNGKTLYSALTGPKAVKIKQ